MISLNWVNDYIDISNEDPKQLAIKITKAGINVEKVITNYIDNLVVGEVISCKKHPNSDHLNICEVDVKAEILKIVCGAHNVRENIKVIVAKTGAILPDNFEIVKSKIRGEESNGMICALFELGVEEKTEENYNKGIHELEQNAIVGEDANKYLNTNDTIYELDVHKHRNNDCYYHIGFAYEIAAIIGKKVKLPDTSYKEEKESIKDIFKINVKTPNCSYYKGKIVKDVKVKPSPEFIQKRLIAAGMRPINNLVDISNYVMLEFGQPLHFFDLDKLNNYIEVDMAKEKEEIITIDNEKRILTTKDIIIKDKEKPICIAGVMGGQNTEIDKSTKNIFIESAIFDSVKIRETANRLNLRSEASIRYGKGLNYEYTDLAISRACHLLEKYADAKILSDELLIDNIEKKETIVKFKEEDISKMLGIKITADSIKEELEKLDFKYTLENNIFVVEIPKRRLDIDPNINDIAEEIGRLYGYNNLISTLPKVNIKKGEYIGDVKYRKLVTKRLRTLGLNEVKTYTLISKEQKNQFYNENNIILPNPMSKDKEVIRNSLIPSLLSVYNYNKSRSTTDISIYEISKVYDNNYQEKTKVSALMTGNFITSTWQKNIKVDFYIIKGILENLLDYMGYETRYSILPKENKDLHPGISADIILDGEKIGVIGKIHPKIIKEDIYIFELDLESIIGKTKKLKYKPALKYPSIEKDMAFIINKEITAQDLIKTINKSGTKLLKSTEVFDLYEGKNIENDKKSIAFKLKFNSEEKTLTDEEVMIIFNKITEKIKEEYNAILRDK